MHLTEMGYDCEVCDRISEGYLVKGAPAWVLAGKINPDGASGIDQLKSVKVLVFQRLCFFANSKRGTINL